MSRQGVVAGDVHGLPARGRPVAAARALRAAKFRALAMCPECESAASEDVSAAVSDLGFAGSAFASDMHAQAAADTSAVGSAFDAAASNYGSASASDLASADASEDYSRSDSADLASYLESASNDVSQWNHLSDLGSYLASWGSHVGSARDAQSYWLESRAASRAASKADSLSAAGVVVPPGGEASHFASEADSAKESRVDSMLWSAFGSKLYESDFPLSDAVSLLVSHYSAEDHASNVASDQVSAQDAGLSDEASMAASMLQSMYASDPTLESTTASQETYQSHHASEVASEVASDLVVNPDHGDAGDMASYYSWVSRVESTRDWTESMMPFWTSGWSSTVASASASESDASHLNAASDYNSAFFSRLAQDVSGAFSVLGSASSASTYASDFVSEVSFDESRADSLVASASESAFSQDHGLVDSGSDPMSEANSNFNSRAYSRADSYKHYASASRAVASASASRMDSGAESTAASDGKLESYHASRAASDAASGAASGAASHAESEASAFASEAVSDIASYDGSVASYGSYAVDSHYKSALGPSYTSADAASYEGSWVGSLLTSALGPGYTPEAASSFMASRGAEGSVAASQGAASHASAFVASAEESRAASAGASDPTGDSAASDQASRAVSAAASDAASGFMSNQGSEEAAASGAASTSASGWLASDDASGSVHHVSDAVSYSQSKIWASNAASWGASNYASWGASNFASDSGHRSASEVGWSAARSADDAHWSESVHGSATGASHEASISSFSGSMSDSFSASVSGSFSGSVSGSFSGSMSDSFSGAYSAYAASHSIYGVSWEASYTASQSGHYASEDASWSVADSAMAASWSAADSAAEVSWSVADSVVAASWSAADSRALFSASVSGSFSGSVSDSFSGSVSGSFSGSMSGSFSASDYGSLDASFSRHGSAAVASWVASRAVSASTGLSAHMASWEASYSVAKSASREAVESTLDSRDYRSATFRSNAASRNASKWASFDASNAASDSNPCGKKKQDECVKAGGRVKQRVVDGIATCYCDHGEASIAASLQSASRIASQEFSAAESKYMSIRDDDEASTFASRYRASADSAVASGSTLASARDESTFSAWDSAASAGDGSAMDSIESKFLSTSTAASTVSRVASTLMTEECQGLDCHCGTKVVTGDGNCFCACGADTPCPQFKAGRKGKKIPIEYDNNCVAAEGTAYNDTPQLPNTDNPLGNFADPWGETPQGIA